MTDYYPYRIATRRGDLTLVWIPEPDDGLDEFATDGIGRLLVFHDIEALQEHCDRDGWELIQEEESALDLVGVRRWVEHPDSGSVSGALLLDAWNFFEDLSRSLESGPSLPSQGPIHNSAYEKFFGSTAGERARTEEESAALREILSAGLDIWEQAARGSGTE